MKNINAVDDLVSFAIKYQDILKSRRDKDFFCRVYRGRLQLYLNRLKAIDFAGCRHVLDAGCGFGQWSLALSFLNEKVSAIDCNNSRVKVGEKISEELRRTNITFLVGSIEELPYDSKIFDTIFCYSTIYQTDYYKSFREFFRVLKPGGSVYISTNDWGWYVYNFIVSHNPSKDFNSRRYAVKTILNTLRYCVTKKYSANADLVMPLKITVTIMKEIGFKNIDAAGEGCLIRNRCYQPKSIYSSRYLGLNNVYEVMGEK